MSFGARILHLCIKIIEIFHVIQKITQIFTGNAQIIFGSVVIDDLDPELSVVFKKPNVLRWYDNRA